MRSRFVPSFAPILVLALASAAHAASPTANAGTSQFAECVNGVGAFQLQGDGEDPDGNPVTFTWTGPFGTLEGQTVDVEVPLGNNQITLEVDDGVDPPTQATTNLIVIDTNPPGVGVSLNPSLLIPPDGSFRDIKATVVVQDVCNLGASYKLHSITSNEPTTQIVVNADYGTPDTEFILGALLTSGLSGNRTYSVFYEATDTQGNVGLGGGDALVAKEGLLDVTPTKMVFRYSTGGDVPPAQSFQATSIIPGSSFEVTSDQPWVRVSQGTGTASTTIDVSVDPSALPPGSHRAKLAVTSEHGVSSTVRVQVFVTDRPEIFAMPEGLTFEHDVSVNGSGVKVQSAPRSQEIFVGSLHAPASFTVTSDGGWLTATTSGTSPTRITVNAWGEDMAIGEHAGSLVINPDDPMRDPVTIPVTMNVIASRGIQAPTYLVNAATMERRPLAPGSLVTGFWDNPYGAQETASGLPLPETLGGVSAKIDGLPVRFSFVSRGQFNALLPMGLVSAGVSQMELYFQGDLAATIPVQILPASPGIFHSNGNALAVNPNGSINGPNNPAPKSSGVAIYVTGQGKTFPLVGDGAAAPGAPFASPVHPLHLVVDGQTVQPLFAALAPGLAGLLQVNVPTAGLAPGAHTVVVSIHSVPSNGVKIYVAE